MIKKILIEKEVKVCDECGNENCQEIERCDICGLVDICESCWEDGDYFHVGLVICDKCFTILTKGEIKSRIKKYFKKLVLEMDEG